MKHFSAVKFNIVKLSPLPPAERRSNFRHGETLAPQKFSTEHIRTTLAAQKPPRLRVGTAAGSKAEGGERAAPSPLAQWGKQPRYHTKATCCAARDPESRCYRKKVKFTPKRFSSFWAVVIVNAKGYEESNSPRTRRRSLACWSSSCMRQLLRMGSRGCSRQRRIFWGRSTASFRALLSRSCSNLPSLSVHLSSRTGNLFGNSPLSSPSAKLESREKQAEIHFHLITFLWKYYFNQVSFHTFSKKENITKTSLKLTALV